MSASSAESAGRERLLSFFDGICHWLDPAVSSLDAEADAVFAKAREVFADLADELPYVDRPQHTMAGASFACAAMLAVFQVLRNRGIDAHEWGRAIHTLPAVVPAEDASSRERARSDAAASQAGAAPNEFVFELVDAGADVDQGMNVTSCAICHLFSKHDAMELVPYMCAFDDRVSDAGDQGLRRSGTIALGASHGDFRFQAGGKPRRLADQYPDQIRLKNA